MQRTRSARALLMMTAGAALAAGLLAAPLRAQEPPRLPSEELLANPQKAARRFDDFSYTAVERQAEANEKVERVRKALAAQKLEGLLIATERNLNWLTAGGKNNVVWAQRETPVKLLVTPARLFLIADNIEGPRMMTEELSGLGYEWIRYDWYGSEAKALEPLVRGKRIAFDHPAAADAYGRSSRRAAPVTFDFEPVYYPITAGERKKYRWLGRKTSEILEQVGMAVRPGMTERDVQYLLMREFWYWDIFPTVVLSAVDERFKTYRHPVVVGAELKDYVALNVCTRRWGLVVSTTRMLHFGEPAGRLAEAWEKGPAVMGAMLAASRPGNTLGAVVQEAQRAYRSIGYPDEWKLHHQGGMILTLERLYLVTPDDRTRIRPGMVLAWNPTVQGAKFEDTVVVNEDGTLENLTPTLRWPSVTVRVNGRNYQVPGLMVRPTAR
jgi:Xaa-Pro dipeptidase